MLVIDDDDVRAARICGDFRGAGLPCLSVNSPEAGLAAIEDDPEIGIAVCASRTADADCLAGVRALAEDRRSANVGLILLSQGGDVDVVLVALKLGVLDFLIEPGSKTGALVDSVRRAQRLLDMRRRSPGGSQGAAGSCRSPGPAPVADGPGLILDCRNVLLHALIERAADHFIGKVGRRRIRLFRVLPPADVNAVLDEGVVLEALTSVIDHLIDDCGKDDTINIECQRPESSVVFVVTAIRARSSTAGSLPAVLCDGAVEHSRARLRDDIRLTRSKWLAETHGGYFEVGYDCDMLVFAKISIPT